MILVTGGTGLVGAHLLYRLVQGNEQISAIYRFESNLEKTKTVFSSYGKDAYIHFEKIVWIRADITDIPSLEHLFTQNFSTVYHCAALVSFEPNDYRAMRKVNIEGTANMINFSITQNVSKFCYVSSIATLDNTVNKFIIDEDNDWNDEEDHHGYAITKYGAEMEVWRGSQEGLDVIIVNPGIILGSGSCNYGSGQLFKQVYKGLSFYTDGVTGFVGVQDVVKAMLLLMHSHHSNKRYILVSENISFKNVLFLIADAFNKKRPSIKLPELLTSMIWRIDWFVSLVLRKDRLLTKQSARTLHYKTSYSSEKIKNDIHIEFENLTTVIKSVASHYSSFCSRY